MKKYGSLGQAGRNVHNRSEFAMGPSCSSTTSAAHVETKAKAKAKVSLSSFSYASSSSTTSAEAKTPASYSSSLSSLKANISRMPHLHIRNL